MAFHPYRPVDPRRFPFYYGWVILCASTVGMFAAVPGSPPGMSPFLEPMLDAYGVRRGEITFAYMLGTIAAGVATWKFGSLFDSVDSRALGTFAFFAVGIALIFTGLGNEVYTALLPEGRTSTPLALLFLTGSFFMLRLFGLGIMMTVARSMIVRWFSRHRSIAVAVNSIAMSLTFSSAPVLVFFLVNWTGWQWAWISMGLFFATVMTTFAFLFFRHSPERAGVPLESSSPDPPPSKTPGMSPRPRGEAHFPVYRDFTPREAVRTLTFWIFIAGIAFNGLIGTGIVINLVAFGTEQGLTESQALALLLPSAIFNILTTLLLGFTAHRIDLRWVLLAMLLGILIEVGSATQLATLPGMIGFAVGGGIAWGCFGMLINLPWPRYFGSRHIGGINGYVTAFTIVASATGPFLFGWIRDATGSFDLAIQGCFFILPLLFFGCLNAKNPQSAYSPSRSG